MTGAGMAAGQRRCRGLSVVELMVALTLGLLVTLVASALLIATNASYVNQAEATRLNDSGLYALEIITRAIRQGAFVDWERAAGAAATPLGLQPEDSANIAGFDARSVSRNSDGIDTPAGTAVNGSDALALRYFGFGAGASGDGSVINCAGFGVGAAETEAQRGWSIFYVAADAAGEAELRCKYRGADNWGADAIVRGVDSFQVLYGLDTDFPADGVANGYLNASAIDALDAALVLDGDDAAARLRDKNKKTYWKRVTSIKVALLHGEQPNATDRPPAQFDLFGKAYADAHAGSDIGVRIDEATLPLPLRGRQRQRVESTIVLRNPPAGEP